MEAITNCFGRSCCQKRPGTLPRWMQDQAVHEKSFDAQKPMSAAYADLDDSARDRFEDIEKTSGYVVTAILDDNDTRSALAPLAELFAAGCDGASPVHARWATPAWKQKAAQAILECLISVFRALDVADPDSDSDSALHRIPLGGTLSGLLAWVRTEAPAIFEWAGPSLTHPALDRKTLAVAVACVAAVAVLFIVAPWALQALGFGELGPIEGSVAARIMARYYIERVPKGSWYSFLQRLGMTWGRR